VLRLSSASASTIPGFAIRSDAEVSLRATFEGVLHGEGVTALHLAAQYDHVESVNALLCRGADPNPTILDSLDQSTPAGWEERGGAEQAEAQSKQLRCCARDTSNSELSKSLEPALPRSA